MTDISAQIATRTGPSEAGFGDYVRLLKPRVMSLVVFTALAGMVAAALLIGYAAAIAINLIRGRSYIDCGCGDTPQMLSGWLLLRNAMLAAGAFTVTLPTPSAAFSWFDLLIAVPAFIVICVIYMTVEQLLENASALREWRELRD